MGQTALACRSGYRLETQRQDVGLAIGRRHRESKGIGTLVGLSVGDSVGLLVEARLGDIVGLSVQALVDNGVCRE